jgi:dolichol kinase
MYNRFKMIEKMSIEYQFVIYILHIVKVFFHSILICFFLHRIDCASVILEACLEIYSVFYDF